MIARRRVLTGGAAASAALALGACSGSGGGGADPTDKKANSGKKVTLWIMQGTNAKADAYIDALKKAFTDKTGATLDVQVQPWDGAHDKFVTAMSGGTGPDVAEVGASWTAEFADAGGLDDLTEDMKKAGVADGWVKGLLDYAVVDKKTYGVPWYAGVRSIVASKKALDAAKVNAQPKDWSELLTMITALKKAKPDMIPFPVAGAAPLSMMSYLWGAGGEIATESGGKWKSSIADPKVVEGLTWYTDLALKHGASSAAANTWKETDSLKAFQQGKVAMFTTGSWVPATIKAAAPDLYDDLVAFTVPGKDKPVAPAVLGGSHLCRFTESKEPELAFALIQLMATGDFATRWAKETAFFPGEQKALDEVVKSGDELTKVFAKQMTEGGKALPVTPAWGKIEGKKTLPTMLSSVLGGTAPQAAASKAASEMDQIFGA